MSRNQAGKHPQQYATAGDQSWNVKIHKGGGKAGEAMRITGWHPVGTHIDNAPTVSGTAPKASLLLHRLALLTKPGDKAMSASFLLIKPGYPVLQD